MYLGLERELHLKVEEYLPAKTQIKVVDQQGLWVQKETWKRIWLELIGSRDLSHSPFEDVNEKQVLWRIVLAELRLSLVYVNEIKYVGWWGQKNVMLLKFLH